MIKNYLKKVIYTFSNNPVQKRIFELQVANRRDLALTNIDNLAKDINIFSPFTREIHKPNDWYGHATNIKKFLGIPLNYKFKFILEHGLYLNEQVDHIDQETDLPTYLTYSSYRNNILKEYRKNVFSIGPFIHYAKSSLSEIELKKERARLGKSVLFFPAHSTDIINLEYDIANLCKELKKISKDYKSIRVCLYWKDILKGNHKAYQKYGFECVTAGHMLDPLFLPRLRSLISISDLTVSNIISSQAGFSVHLGKPHIIINQKINLKTDKYWNKRINDVFKSEAYIEVLKEFAKTNYRITAKQKLLVDKYWGSGNIKTKSQLKRIIKETERIYQDGS